MKTARTAVMLGILMGMSLPSYAQLASLVMGGLQALPQVMSNTYEKLTADPNKCEQELAEARANMKSVQAAHPEARGKLEAFEGIIQAKYQNCKQRAEKAQNGSIIDEQVVATAVGGAIGYQGMIGAATAAGSISAATGSNAVALQAMGMDPRMAHAGAMASGGMPMTSIFPALGMPGVFPGTSPAAPLGAGVVGIPGITGMGAPADIAATTILGRVIGGVFTNKSQQSGFVLENLLKVEDVALATGTREQVRSSLAAKGRMPQTPEKGYEGFGDTYTVDNNKTVPGATSLSLGYLTDGRIALSVYDITKLGKPQLEEIAKTVTERYGKPAVQQEGAMTRATWSIEGGSLFMAKDGAKTSLGWRNEERLAQLVAELQATQQAATPATMTAAK